MKDSQIVTHDDPRFAVALEAVAPVAEEDHPAFGAFGRAYYPAALAGLAMDVSVAVFGGHGVELVLLGSIQQDEISYFGMPMQPRFARGLSEKRMRSSLGTALAYLAERFPSASCRIADPECGQASDLGRIMLAMGASPTVVVEAVASLEGSEADLLRPLRKSYRSLVNWGRRSLNLTHINRENPDRAGFDRYREFHLKVAGRVTRPLDSWNIMFDTLKRGMGELSLGEDMQGRLLAATLVIDGAAVAQYASAVYEREEFDQPLAHWPVVSAMLRAKDRGMKYFDLGVIPSQDAASEKEFNIGRFKRGFTDRFVYRIVWTLPLQRTLMNEQSHAGNLNVR